MTNQKTKQTNATQEATLSLWMEKLQEGLAHLKNDEADAAEAVLSEVTQAEDQAHDKLTFMDSMQHSLFRAKKHELAGNLARKRADYHDAIHHYREMIRDEEAGQEPLRGIGNSYGKLGAVLGKAGHYQEATEAFQRALQMMKEGGSEATYRASINFEFAEMFEDADRPEEALDQWKATLALVVEASSSPYVMAFTKHRLGRALKRVEQLDAAEAVLAEALSHLQEDPREHLAMRCWRDLSEIYLQQQEISKALDAISNAQKLIHACNRSEHADILELFARVCLRVSRFQDAIVFFMQAHQIKDYAEEPALSRLTALIGLKTAYEAIERYDMATLILKDIIAILQEHDAFEETALFQAQHDAIENKPSAIEIIRFSPT